MENLEKLKRERVVLARQLASLNGRLMAGDRSLRTQVAAASRQVARIEERIQALTGEKQKEQ